MKLDPEDLRRHYAMLSDEALLDTNRSELVEIAQGVYDEELARRQLRPARRADKQPDDKHGELGEEEDAEFESGLEPDWLPEAACAITFDASPGHDTAPDADNARTALEAVGIPCYIDRRKVDPPSVKPEPHYTYNIMVPGKFNLQAVSALDHAIYNPEMEAQYRAHFESLSDEELRAVDPEVLMAGLTDRIERLTRAYNEERARRHL